MTIHRYVEVAGRILVTAENEVRAGIAADAVVSEINNSAFEGVPCEHTVELEILPPVAPIYSEPDDPVCPACGSTLSVNQDPHGTTYQCPDLTCLQFYEAGEIVG